jgi:hypothetical protein
LPPRGTIQNLVKSNKMKRNVGIILTIAAIGLGGYLLYIKWKEKKIDESETSYNEALKKLEEAKKQ